MKRLLPLLLFTLGVFSAGAYADGQTVYKWTDADGVIHYSDKPPQEAAADLQTMDLPALPPQDPAKIAADQAALAARTAVLVQQQQAAAALQQRDEELALERAELEATQQALQQRAAAAVQSAPVYAIYAGSRFFPRSYRRNLYVPHYFPERPALPVMRPVPMPSRPPIALTRKP